jgi:CHAT domain-containing protein/tetratricopeptide (TPR) repeat protein
MLRRLLSIFPLWIPLRRLFGILLLAGVLVAVGLGPVPWHRDRLLAQPPPMQTSPVQIPLAQANPAQANPAQQVQQGVDRYQAADYAGAIALWQSALQAFQQTNQRENQAIVLSNIARAQQQLGQSPQAIVQWEQVIRLYRQLGNLPQVGKALTEQAQAYIRIGQPRQAIALLCKADASGQCTMGSALQLAIQGNDRLAQLAALGTLGNAYRLLGDYDRAEQNLKASLQQAEQVESPQYRLSALNSLGILYTTLAQIQFQNATLAQQGGDTAEELANFQRTGQQYDQRAIAALEQSLQLAQGQNNSAEQVRSLLSLIPAYFRSQSAAEASRAWQQARQILDRLPDNRDRVFAAIDLAQLVQPDTTVSRQRCFSASQLAQAEPLLQEAVDTARRIQDARAESFALGELAQVAECRREFATALALTEQARLAADQNLAAKDSLYLWEWQSGRIMRSQWEASGKTSTELLNAAIASYERAIATLETIRGDILTATRDIQFDFRDTIDPIYRELVELKLSRETPVPSASKTKAMPEQQNPQNFRSILDVIENLKLAELQNYFGSECVVAVLNPNSATLSATSGTAVFNTIILDNQTAVIVSMPNQPPQFHWIELPRQEVIDQINQFRIGLEDARFNYDPKPAQQLYDWLVRPFEADLQAAQVKTLVFVQDGSFRTVPMAALHDGQEFLIQRYAIAITPSLKLIDAQPPNRANLRVLALGLSKAKTVDGKAFDALPSVVQELAGIAQVVPGSKQLLDADFTRDRLKQELGETVYPILHLATHGKFATNPKDTFIITGDGQKLNFTELDQLIRSTSRNPEPLELLSLTACETAVGNDRSALGLAGVAVQAGARSALASLWAVDDAATAKLSTEFYTRLQNPQLTKAEALRSLQKDLVEGKVTVEGFNATHPAYWSPFVLIGNWL